VTFIYDTPCVGGPRDGKTLPAVFRTEHSMLPLSRKVRGFMRPAGYYRFVPRRHNATGYASNHGDTWVWHPFFKAKLARYRKR
jgi:hypothetical protein